MKRRLTPHRVRRPLQNPAKPVKKAWDAYGREWVHSHPVCGRCGTDGRMILGEPPYRLFCPNPECDQVPWDSATCWKKSDARDTPPPPPKKKRKRTGHNYCCGESLSHTVRGDLYCEQCGKLVPRDPPKVLFRAKVRTLQQLCMLQVVRANLTEKLNKNLFYDVDNFINSLSVDKICWSCKTLKWWQVLGEDGVKMDGNWTACNTQKTYNCRFLRAK